MSHYSCIKTKVTNREALVKALCELGFKKEQIEVSDTKMSLRGYEGDERSQKANIRIKGNGWKGQNHVGGESNDLGWELMHDGTYAFHLSEYDSNRYDTTWQQKLTQQYSKAVLEETIDQQGWFVTEEKKTNGEIHLTVQSLY